MAASTAADTAPLPFATWPMAAAIAAATDATTTDADNDDEEEEDVDRHNDLDSSHIVRLQSMQFDYV